LRVTGGTSTIITISTKKTLFPQALKNYGLTFNPCLPLGGHKPGSIKKWSFGTFVNVVRKANIALANNLLSEEKMTKEWKTYKTVNRHGKSRIPSGMRLWTGSGNIQNSIALFAKREQCGLQAWYRLDKRFF
jgi:hypothetical protein